MHKKTIILLFLTSSLTHLLAQELYVFSNPASNIPARSLMIKAMGKSITTHHNHEQEYRFASELQAGIYKNLMIAGAVSCSNMFFQNQQAFESFRLYAKYRFLSKDDVHKHFRMALHSSYVWSQNPLVYQEMNTEGDNTGWQTGLIATGLVHKLAVSGGISYLQLEKGKRKINFGYPFSENALSYNISLGYLLFPFEYKDYRQLNMNVYCEFLGQQNTDLNTGFLDVAPAIQFIIASKMRINAGARYQLTGSAYRMAQQAYYVSMEYYLLNFFNKKK